MDMEIAEYEDTPGGGTEVARKSCWHRVLHWQHLGLCILVIATLAIHFITIMNPNAIVWDETWYVNDARSIISGAGDLRPEHPPLAKLFVVAGTLMFGDNALGWRFFSVIFGTIAIVLFYFICRKLRMPQKAILLATFLFALDDMNFVESSLALLDVYMVTFMLAGFLFYLYKGYLLSGVSIALSALCKLTGGLAFIAIFLHWIVVRRDRPGRFLASIIVTATSFLALIAPFDYLTFGKLMNPIQRTLEMLNLTAANVFTDPPLSISSRPWEWLLPWNVIVYSYDPQYIAFISWTIQILIIPVVIYMIYKARKGNDACHFGLAWFLATYLIWIPLSIITNRVSFVFYFYPTIGAICIGIGLALADRIGKLETRTAQLGKVTAGGKIHYIGIGIYLALHLAIFIIFNPAVPVLIKLWLPPFAS